MADREDGESRRRQVATAIQANAVLMPTRPDGKINSEYVLRFLRHFAKGEMLCFVCKRNEWIVAEDAVEVMPYPLPQKGRVETFRPQSTFGSDQYPLVMIACNVCGYAFFLSAAMIGLVGDEEADGN